MKIETKYNLGDEVWFMRYDRIQSGHICEVLVRYTTPNWYSEVYKVKEWNSGLNSPTFTTHELFKTKQELIESL